MQSVYLVPGFLVSTLVRASDGAVRWWDPNQVLRNGLNPMRLAPDGVSPGTPGGEALVVDPNPVSPWDDIAALLEQQLPQGQYQLIYTAYDWRLLIESGAAALAAKIRARDTATNPATIVGHSMGGLIACAAWSQLLATGDTAKVRRIISIDTPFLGSYSVCNTFTGNDPSVQQIVALGSAVAPGLVVIGLQFLLPNVVSVFLTWPSFYELYPSLQTAWQTTDPNRALLYTAANYPAGPQPSQAWLDHSKNVWQPLIAGASAMPPEEVMTAVLGTSLFTANTLNSARVPIDLGNLRGTLNGDGVVTIASSFRSSAALYLFATSHANAAINLARSGTLAKLITDPRMPGPPPPQQTIKDPSPFMVNDPPDRTPVGNQTCIGGHCLQVSPLVDQ